MGQAKRRGTYDQRVAQATAANATLEAELREVASPMLKDFIDKNGVQDFRVKALRRHIIGSQEVSTSFTASNEDVNAQNESCKQSLVDSIMKKKE